MEEKNSTFGIKHILGLIFVVGLSASIIVYSDKLNEFSHYGYIGAFVAMFVSYASVILPTPGLAFLFALGHALPNPFFIGILGGLGGALGETVGYIAGLSGSGIVRKVPAYDKIEFYVSKYGLIAIFMLSVVPNPLFDLAGISAGALGIKWWKFLIAVTLGTTIKAMAVAYTGSLLS